MHREQWVLGSEVRGRFNNTQQTLRGENKCMSTRRENMDDVSEDALFKCGGKREASR